MFRTAGIAASVAFTVGALAGCASQPIAPVPTITITAAPSQTVDAGVLPVGSALEAWAETALPVNKPGGATYVVRASGEVRPGMDAIIDVTQPEGRWVVAVACQSTDGSPLSLTAAPVGLNAVPPLVCSTPGDTAGGEVLRYTYDGGLEGTLTLRATAPAVFVYEISPHAAGQD